MMIFLASLLSLMAAADAGVSVPSPRATKVAFKCTSFEQYKGTVFREPIANGVYVVNGDTAISDETQLRKFYEQFCPPKDRSAYLTVSHTNGVDSVWSEGKRKVLIYCVSKDFGARRPDVVKAMKDAASAWEAAADVKFGQKDPQTCDSSSGDVVFDVRPVKFQEYLARSFFPNDARPARSLLIDDTAFSTQPPLTLTGILRHELGHTLGFRHEHTRPQAGTCFEDEEWRGVTSYDPYSVMHYPQCNGKGDWSLTLTDKDKAGAASIYGPPHAATKAGALTGGPQKTVGLDVSYGAQEVKEVGVLAVKPGSVFLVSTTAPAQVFVQFGSRGRETGFDCVATAGHHCEIEVPKGQSDAMLVLQSETAGSTTVTVTYSPKM